MYFLFLTFTCLLRFAPVWEQVIRKCEVTFIIREREFLIVILQMLRCAGVKMCRCADVNSKMCRYGDVEMWRCAGVEMCSCADVKEVKDVQEVKMCRGEGTKIKCATDIQHGFNLTIQNTGPIRSYLHQNSPQGRLIHKWSRLCINLDKCDPSLTMKLYYIPPA